MSNLVYYYAYNYASGDYQYGYAYDDGSYGYYDGQYWYTSDENGNYWLYEVSEVYSGYSGTSGYNYVVAYSDGETDAYVIPSYYDAGYATGMGGIGSGGDYADLNGNGVLESGEYFSSYSEADVVGSSEPSDTLYYYYAYNTSGDSYYGYTVADTGSYATGEYVSLGTTDYDGGTWTYYVYGTYDYGYETGIEGYDSVDSTYAYYDADTGYGATGFTSYSTYGGIGSSYGTVNSSGEYFGSYGYYEADASSEPSDTLYYYTAYNTSGDFYYGYTVADTGSYSVGQYVSYGTTDNDGGSWTYYVSDAYNYGYETGIEGYDAIISDYYDSDTGYGYVVSSNYSSYGGLGSSYGYVSSGDYFGSYGYGEADMPSEPSEPLDTLYYYYAYNTSGDSYYGYTVADTGSYAIGEIVSRGTTDNDGGAWTYSVYGTYDYGYETGIEGYDSLDSTYAYYDADTGYGATGFTSYSTYEGIGTSYGTVNSSGELFGYYGYYEADASGSSSGVNLVTYSAYNSASGDYLYGYAYDDGTYGYTAGETWTTSDENGSFWLYAVSSVEGGHSGTSGHDYASIYDDGETDAYAFTSSYISSTPAGTLGIGSGGAYADLNGNGSYETAEYFSSYHEADFA